MNFCNLYWFNPTNELAVANGLKTYMPPRHLKRFEDELASLLNVFCKEDDLLLSIPFSKEFSRAMQEAGFFLPKTLELSSKTVLKDWGIKDLRPWGWSPAAHFALTDLKKQTHSFISNKRDEWEPELRFFHSREFSSAVLNLFLQRTEIEAVYISNLNTSQKCTKAFELEKLLESWGSCVCKSPWSSSGRGLQFIRQPELNQSIVQWFRGCVAKQGYCMIEPVHEKVLDFSLQFEVAFDGSVRFLGHTFFKTNQSGQYDCTYLNAHNYLSSSKAYALVNKTIDDLVLGLLNVLKKTDLSKYYKGVFGVDCMLVDECGMLKIHPCVEINLRYTMGYVAMVLEQKLSPDSWGTFSVAMNQDAFHQQAEMQKSRKAVYSNGKIKSGYISLTDIRKTNIHWAYMDVYEM